MRRDLRAHGNVPLHAVLAASGLFTACSCMTEPSSTAHRVATTAWSSSMPAPPGWAAHGGAGRQAARAAGRPAGGDLGIGASHRCGRGFAIGARGPPALPCSRTAGRCSCRRPSCCTRKRYPASRTRLLPASRPLLRCLAAPPHSEPAGTQGPRRGAPSLPAWTRMSSQHGGLDPRTMLARLCFAAAVPCLARGQRSPAGAIHGAQAVPTGSANATKRCRPATGTGAANR